ncbi:MAG TPA: hypothetical protein VGN20_08515 [Mucilaginibacter sp.]|jgi:hypothetical protein
MNFCLSFQLSQPWQESNKSIRAHSLCCMSPAAKTSRSNASFKQRWFTTLHYIPPGEATLAVIPAFVHRDKAKPGARLFY